MSPFHHRDPGIVGLLGTTRFKRPYYGLICDGIHADKNSVKIAYDSHPGGAVLVTDAMAAMGLSHGKYNLGSMEVEVGDFGVRIVGTDTIAGRYYIRSFGFSVISMPDCIANFRRFTGCSIVQAIEAATLHPAKSLGLNNKGSLEPGCDADFLFLDDDLNVKETFISGTKFNF